MAVKTSSPLNNLAAQEIAIILAPIYKALTALQQPGANAETLIQTFNQVELEEIENVPAIEQVGINVLAADAEAKLKAWQASLAASSGSGSSSAGGSSAVSSGIKIVR